MKTIKKIAKNKFFVSFMSFMLLFTTSYSANAARINFVPDSGLSGEQMFREIFFLQNGDLVESLPNAIQEEYAAINNLTSEEKELRNSLINNVVSFIKDNSPGYFDSLKQVVTSQDPYQLKEKLGIGGDLILTALSLQGEYKSLSEYLGDRKVDLNDRDEVKNLVNELRAQASSNNLQYADEFACIAFAFALVLAVAIAGVAVVVSVIVEVI